MGQHHIHHQVARGTQAYLHIAQPAGMVFYVVKWHAQRQCLFLQRFADEVSGLGLQVALGNGHHFIKYALGMKTRTRHFHRHIGVFDIGIAQVAFGSKSVLQLVAVGSGLRSALYGQPFCHFHMTNSCELIFYLLLLVGQLFLVGQHLPLAAAAGTKMAAKSINAVGAWCYQLKRPALGIVFFVFKEKNIHHIAGNGTLHKYGLTLHPGEALALGGIGFHVHTPQYLILFLSGHGAKVGGGGGYKI